MSSKIKQLIKLLETKDIEADVEFVVVETTGNLVCMDIETNAHQMAELLSIFRPSLDDDERDLHWSDVLDVQLDASRDKVEKKYKQLIGRYSRGESINNEFKLTRLHKAWEEYNQ